MAKQKTKEDLKDSKAQGSENKPEKDGKKGLLHAILAFVTALMVIAIVVGGAFYIVIHNNINGLADKYRDDIKDIPILSLALPKTVTPDDPENYDKEKLLSLYKQYKAENEDLKGQLKDYKEQNLELIKYKENADSITKEGEKLKSELEKEKAELEKYKKEVDELVARGDVEGFSEYFVKINAQTAEKIYREIVEKEKEDQEAKQFAQLYEKMDTGSSAKIFENLGQSKIDLISYTLKNMKKDVAAEIISEMSNEFAADVTDKLAKDYGINLAQ